LPQTYTIIKRILSPDSTTCRPSPLRLSLLAFARKPGTAARFAPAAIVPDVPGILAIGAVSGLILAAVLLAGLLYRLRKQKALLSELFERAPQAVALTTPDGRVLLINREFTRTFGYTSQAAIGRPLGELIVPAESLSMHQIHTASVAEGRRVDAEIVCRRQDGSRFPAAITLAPFSATGQHAGVYAIYRDLAEQRRAEEARRTSEARWRSIFDTSAVGISVTNTDGSFIATNRIFQEIVGYSEEELRSLTFMDVTCDEDRPANAALAAGIWAGRVTHFQMEKRYRRKDGQTIWVKITCSKGDGDGTAPSFGVCIVEDIAERKRAEASLQRYRQAVECFHEMIVVVDHRYRYVFANQAFLGYHGLKRDQVVGHSVAELVGQERFEKVTKNNVDECFRGKVVRCYMEMDFSALGRRDLFGSYFPIEGPAGIDRVAVVLEDITEQKRAERDLQRSFEELHALNARLQNVREDERAGLARELHDQLGQSLTAIRIDLAALKAAPDPALHLQRIDSLLDLVDGTIHSVRRISTELRPGILDDMGLVAAVEWAAEDFQARTGIRCHAELPQTHSPIDPKRATALFRILQETLTNIARHAGATQACIVLSLDSSYITLEVRDNGRGIGSEQPSASKSLGILGMRERAVLLGGDFSIAGGPGGGAVVRARIPFGEGPPPETLT
jgi:PAS domain S-box-containing protein